MQVLTGEGLSGVKPETLHFNKLLETSHNAAGMWATLWRSKSFLFVF